MTQYRSTPKIASSRRGPAKHFHKPRKRKLLPGIHHAAICTSDVERSLRFWRDGLGFTELFDHTFTGDWPELFGAKSDRLRSIFLGDPQTSDSGIVELVVFEGADDGSTPPRRPGTACFL